MIPIGSVNSQPYEEVINKNIAGFTGCSTDIYSATCGVAYDDHHDIIKHSQGFCCSCDPYVNINRQPSGFSQNFIHFNGDKPSNPSERVKRNVNAVKETLYKLWWNEMKLELKEDTLQQQLNSLNEGLIPHFNKRKLVSKLKNFCNTFSANTDHQGCNNTCLKTQKNKEKILILDSKGRSLSNNTNEDIYNPFIKQPDLWNNLLTLTLNSLNQTINGLSQDEIVDIITDLKDIKFTSRVRRYISDNVEYNASNIVENVVKPLVCKNIKNKIKKESEYLKNIFKENINLTSYTSQRTRSKTNFTTTTLSDIETYETNAERHLLSHLKIHPNKQIERKIKNIVKRQITSSGVQVRGGQSCVDRSVPSLIENSESYHESAHCLRFNSSWFTVYKLKSPSIVHSVAVDIFEKRHGAHGSDHWEHLSKGMDVKLTSDSGAKSNKNNPCTNCPNITMTYLPLENNIKTEFCLNLDNLYILAPERNQDKSNQNQHRLYQGGPAEYLVVKQDEVSLEGDTCNKIGVGYSAFLSQYNRCGKTKGSCLQNQIADLWNRDKLSKNEKKLGKYFLENYASIPDEDAHAQKGDDEILKLNYLRQYSGAVEIQLSSHIHTIIDIGHSAVVSEVYIDATRADVTEITSVVVNFGLVSSQFRLILAECPAEMSRIVSDMKKLGLVTIHPQHNYTFRIPVRGNLPADRLSCWVHLFNSKKELVAKRNIKIQKADRCICVQHCKCACVGSQHGLRCDAMSLKEYHLAGFRGSLPEELHSFANKKIPTLKKISLTSWKALVDVVLNILIVFLLLGLSKAIIGVCCVDFIGNYGVWLLITKEAKGLTKYKEDELQNEQIVYDALEFPVHPYWGTRTILYTSPTRQFCLNCVFYFVLSFMVLRDCLHYVICVAASLLGCCFSCQRSNQKKENIGKNTVRKENSKKEKEDDSDDVESSEYDSDDMEKSQTYLKNCFDEANKILSQTK